MAGARPEQVIELSLAEAGELFELPQGELFSEDRNFLTGVDYCLGVLRSRPSRAPVRLEVTLPAAEVDDGTPDRLRRTLGRYCDHRIAHNQREVRTARLDGLSSLTLGVPLAVVGLLVVTLAARLVSTHGNPNLVLETLGGVLAWVGLWYPLDTMVFTPASYGRENRALRRLHDAEVSVRVRPGLERSG